LRANGSPALSLRLGVDQHRRSPSPQCCHDQYLVVILNVDGTLVTGDKVLTDRSHAAV